eukprot:snap_masked-scaffold_3-processed-gene-4.10-mRNA-1 protein AED:1.00 eAED:1.00 QI:0/-1/0/0/-1/1/1/0/79
MCSELSKVLRIMRTEDDHFFFPVDNAGSPHPKQANLLRNAILEERMKEKHNFSLEVTFLFSMYGFCSSTIAERKQFICQ